MSRAWIGRGFRALLLAGLLAPAAARADHAFILPSGTSYAGTNGVATFDAAASDHVFFFDHRPIPLGAIRIWRPDGAAGTPYNALQGRFRSVFDVRLDQPGTWKLASEQTMIGGSFKLDGEEFRVGRRPGGPAGTGAPGAPNAERRDGGERPPPSGGPGGPEGGPRRKPPVDPDNIPAGATDVHLTETLSRTETFVTAGAPTTIVLKPSGRGLELEPITHPNAIAAGETARFRFLLDGKPAAGLKVTVIAGGDRYREATDETILTTGSDGVVAVKWPAAGMYWIGTEATDRNPSDARAGTRRLLYAATLEVMTP